MPILTSDLKVKFLGITPALKDETGVLNPQEIVAFSALLTFKGKSVQTLLKESREKGQDINEKIKNILRKSSLRGHASMATTPALCFSYEGSKFLDSALTGLVFASALMSSGRRTETSIEDIVYPINIFENKKTRKIYKEVSEKNISFLNYLLTQGVQKDEASKILQYGIYGTGLIQLTIESIVALKREYQTEKEWFPEDIGFLIEKIEKELKRFGIDLLYTTRVVAPRNFYPWPHIFTDPKKPNLVRDLRKRIKMKDDFKIISNHLLVTSDLKKRLENLKKEIKKAIKDKKKIKENWLKLISMRQEICRDYHLAANFKILSSVAWRVWGEKKRHRTVPMVVESVYFCVERAAKVFKKYKKAIQNKKLTQKLLNKINNVFSLPPTIRKNKVFIYQYLERALNSIEAYLNLIKLGVKPREAIFIIPRGLKLDVLQDYNFYNLIAGYYPLRICSTAEEELWRLSRKEAAEIKKILNQKGLNWLAEYIVSKCLAVGFCPEEKFCGLIKSLVPNYDENIHQEMKVDLENKFQENLKKLNNDFRGKKTFRVS